MRSYLQLRLCTLPQELFVRIASNTVTDEDWKGGRPKSLSRVHESIRSHPEFQNLHKNIESNFARGYLEGKATMSRVISRDLEM